jgi:hypothetical protein
VHVTMFTLVATKTRPVNRDKMPVDSICVYTGGRPSVGKPCTREFRMYPIYIYRHVHYSSQIPLQLSPNHIDIAMHRRSRKVDMPDNPTWIKFSRSDGNPHFWPAQTEPVIDKAGEVDYVRIVPLDHGRSIKWRREIAMALAPMMGLQGTFLKFIRQLPISLPITSWSVIQVHAHRLAQGIRHVQPSQRQERRPS